MWRPRIRASRFMRNTGGSVGERWHHWSDGGIECCGAWPECLSDKATTRRERRWLRRIACCRSNSTSITPLLVQGSLLLDLLPVVGVHAVLMKWRVREVKWSACSDIESWGLDMPSEGECRSLFGCLESWLRLVIHALLTGVSALGCAQMMLPFRAAKGLKKKIVYCRGKGMSGSLSAKSVIPTSL
jgi:hypothetical protein